MVVLVVEAAAVELTESLLVAVDIVAAVVVVRMVLQVVVEVL